MRIVDSQLFEIRFFNWGKNKFKIFVFIKNTKLHFGHTDCGNFRYFFRVF